MNTKGKIGVFDSGIGGVTVLKEIIKIMPQEDYIYYSDSINNPYGEKTNEKLQDICDNIMQYFIEKECKAVVIACNTATTKVAKYLREKYVCMPIIAIEPAYKMVFDYAYEKPTLVMATKGTIESEKFNLLYEKYNNYKTYLLPCIGLADMIENGDLEEIRKYLEEELKEYKGKVENVVLGCTHYPLIEKEIKRILGTVTFFNGAERLAIYLKKKLEENNLLKKGDGNIEFFDSSQEAKKKERFFNYLKEELL